jgi:hypothetical protein
VELKDGYYLEWGGQFQNLERAMGHLTIIIPVTVGDLLPALPAVRVAEAGQPDHPGAAFRQCGRRAWPAVYG